MKKELSNSKSKVDAKRNECEPLNIALSKHLSLSMPAACIHHCAFTTLPGQPPQWHQNCSCKSSGRQSGYCITTLPSHHPASRHSEAAQPRRDSSIASKEPSGVLSGSVVIEAPMLPHEVAKLNFQGF